MQQNTAEWNDKANKQNGQYLSKIMSKKSPTNSFNQKHFGNTQQKLKKRLNLRLCGSKNNSPDLL